LESFQLFLTSHGPPKDAKAMPTPSESRPIWPDSCRSQHLSHRDQKQGATRPTEKCREARDYKITMILLRARRRWDGRTNGDRLLRHKRLRTFLISQHRLHVCAVETAAHSNVSTLLPVFPHSRFVPAISRHDVSPRILWRRRAARPHDSDEQVPTKKTA